MQLSKIWAMEEITKKARKVSYVIQPQLSLFKSLFLKCGIGVRYILPTLFSSPLHCLPQLSYISSLYHQLQKAVSAFIPFPNLRPEFQIAAVHVHTVCPLQDCSFCPSCYSSRCGAPTLVFIAIETGGFLRKNSKKNCTAYSRPQNLYSQYYILYPTQQDRIGSTQRLEMKKHLSSVLALPPCSSTAWGKSHF